MSTAIIGYCLFSWYYSNSPLGYFWVFVVAIVGLEILFPVSYILLCVSPPVDSMVGRPVSILCFPQLRCVGLYRFLPSYLMLDVGVVSLKIIFVVAYIVSTDIRFRSCT